MNSKVSRNPRGKSALASVKRTDRTRTILIQVGVAVVLIGLIAAIGISIAVKQARKNDPGPTPTITAQPASPDAVTASITDNGSIRIGKAGAKPVVRVVADLQCPACQMFEQANGPMLTDMVNSGKVAVDYNIIAMLDPNSGGNSHYSSRAASAAYCVAEADPTKFQGWLANMFKQQPPEGAGGLPDDKLVQIAKDSGYTDPATAQCISDQKYTKYSLKKVTNEAIDAGINQTPTIFVNGQRVTGQDLMPDALRQKIEAAAK
ncbi:DsbA family protein [Nocardia transvalensis]|uniref:DsbA family protein n=1 Tax=Nocardia transvalensis TaxID=37333 RepID=UPI002B4B665C|nr:thioredoxin domain-containing protein [Nocardia transvalensis]